MHIYSDFESLCCIVGTNFTVPREPMMQAKKRVQQNVVINEPDERKNHLSVTTESLPIY